MTEAMKLLASGDSSVEIPARGRKDEVGQIADAVQVFKENAIEMERPRREQPAAEGRAVEEKKRERPALGDRLPASRRSSGQTVSLPAAHMPTTTGDLTTPERGARPQPAHVCGRRAKQQPKT